MNFDQSSFFSGPNHLPYSTLCVAPPTCLALPPAGSTRRKPRYSPAHSAPWWRHWRRAQNRSLSLRVRLGVPMGRMTSLIRCTLYIAERKQEMMIVLQQHFLSSAVTPPHLKVVLRHDDGTTAGHVCAGVLAVAMRVTSLPQVMVGCTLSESAETLAISSFLSVCVCLKTHGHTHLLSSTGPTLRRTLKARCK